MNTDVTGQCDECGRDGRKIHRVHRGIRYCNTCYVREFVPKACPRCGHTARLARREPGSVCQRCQRAAPCVRCGRLEYPTGKITAYGPACNSCAPYFRDPKPCDSCGVPSSRRSRVSRQQHDLGLCPRCARADFGTCGACHRHRRLSTTADGRELCRKCHQHGDTPCLQCGRAMPAGYGLRCAECYWQGLFTQRLRTNRAAFSTIAIADHFDAFTHWLARRSGTHRAAITVNRYLPFFMTLDQRWQEIPAYDVLLKHYGAIGLRRASLPVLWMESARLVCLDRQKKSDDSERRRIATALKLFDCATPNRVLIRGYYRRLRCKLRSGHTSLRSIRLNLRPAAALLQEVGADNTAVPHQRHLNDYLAGKPGQRAAVSAFVRYLRETRGAALQLPRPNPRKAEQKRRKALEAELLAMIRTPSGFENLKTRWICCALEYFHGLPARQARELHQHSNCSAGSDGVSVDCVGRRYWIPHFPA